MVLFLLFGELISWRHQFLVCHDGSGEKSWRLSQGSPRAFQKLEVINIEHVRNWSLVGIGNFLRVVQVKERGR